MIAFKTEGRVKLWCSVMLMGMAALLRGEPPRTGLVRGVILEMHPGGMSVRSVPGDVYRFSFDSRTWIERARERIAGSSLVTGELLEVVSDRDGQPQYARLIHVLDRNATRPPVREGQFRLYRKKTEQLSEPESLEYTGVALRMQGGALTLRTRLDGVKTIYVRPDTHCLNDGLEVPVASLPQQTRVFVRAIRNVDSELEATQIIWGKLLRSNLNWE